MERGLATRAPGPRTLALGPSSLVGAVAAALLAAGFSGCAPARPSGIAIQRQSYSDDTSRRLARESLGLLKDRSTDYRLGPEDIIEVSIFQWEQRDETRTLDVRVTETGVIALPVLGDLKIADLTAEQVKDLLERRLREGGILLTPRVSVLVKEFRSRRIAVVGAVHEPGVYTLRQNVGTIVELLTLAGGITERAGQVAYIVRKDESSGIPEPAAEPRSALTGPPPAPSKTVIAIDLYELLEEGNAELNAVVRNGDMINVPQAKEFSVLGYVTRPGRFPLTHSTTVLEAIALAEGIREREASPSDSVLKRQTAGGILSIPLDLDAISNGDSPNLELLPNDVIEVRQTFSRHAVLEILDLFRGLFTFGYTLNRS